MKTILLEVTLKRIDSLLTNIMPGGIWDSVFDIDGLGKILRSYIHRWHPLWTTQTHDDGAIYFVASTSSMSRIKKRWEWRRKNSTRQ